MAKYCTVCGRELQEGEVCNCASQQSSYQPKDVNLNGESGYQQGYDPNQAGGYQQGYDLNQAGGYQQGYDPNQAGGYQQGYDSNQTGGYQQGYDPNQAGGYQQGYNPNQAGGYQQGYNPNQAGGYQQGYNSNQAGGNQQGGYQQTLNKQWDDTKNVFVENSKQLFSQIGPLFKHPNTTIKKMFGMENRHILGVEMLGVYVIACWVAIILVGLRINSSLSSVGYGYSSRMSVGFPFFRIMLIILIGIAACSAVSAALNVGMVIAFKGKTDFGAMLLTQGISSLLQGIGWLLAAFCLLLGWWIPAGLLWGLTFALGVIWSNIAFHHAVQMDSDKEVYAYFTAKILASIAVSLIVVILCSIFIGSYLVELQRYM